MMLRVIEAIVSNIVSWRPKLDITLVSGIETAALGWSLLSEKIASGMRLKGVWLPQLNWVVTSSLLPTCKRKGWCCHDTGLFSFFHQSFPHPTVFDRLSYRSLSTLT